MPNIPIHPETASNFADRFNPLFYALLALTIVFAGGVFAVVLFLAIRYREGSSAPRHRPERATPKLEMTLIGLPTILGLGIFFWGAKLYTDERNIPANATEILVIGKQWMWQMYHQEGVREMNELTLPVDQPVRLTMVSQDVIHAFYVPAFRVQYYVLPGRYTGLWFTPNKVGAYHLYCNQYCGTDHSKMVGRVNVLSRSDYAEWLAKRIRPGGMATLSVSERGKALFTSNGCALCHGSKDTAKAPTLTGLFGKVRHFSDGTSAVADADYIRNALTQPERFRVAGYPESMISYTTLGASDVWALVKYVEAQ
jgi:cytochrome c oxidase subunit 2